MMSDGYYTNMIYQLIKLELIRVVDQHGITYEQLVKFSKDELIKLIPHEITSDKVKIIENILIPCSLEDTETSYCKDKKLLVPTNFEDFIEIVMYEIKDPYYNFMDNTRRSLVINDINFEIAPNEKIEVNIV